MSDRIMTFITAKNCPMCNIFKGYTPKDSNRPTVWVGTGKLKRRDPRIKGDTQDYTVEFFRKMLTGLFEERYPAPSRISYILEIEFDSMAATKPGNICKIVKHKMVDDHVSCTSSLYSCRFEKIDDGSVKYSVDVNGVENAEYGNALKNTYINSVVLPPLYEEIYRRLTLYSQPRFIEYLSRVDRSKNLELMNSIDNLILNQRSDNRKVEMVKEFIVKKTNEFICFDNLVNAMIPGSIMNYFRYAPMWIIFEENHFYRCVEDPSQRLYGMHNSSVNNLLPMRENNVMTSLTKEQYTNPAAPVNPLVLITKFSGKSILELYER